MQPLPPAAEQSRLACPTTVPANRLPHRPEHGGLLVLCLAAALAAIPGLVPPAAAAPHPELEEANQLQFPPLSLGAVADLERRALMSFPNEDLVLVARRIEAGTASMQERRWFYRSAERYAPFQGAPPPGWQLQAARAAALLDVRSAPSGSGTVFSWTPIGPTGSYDVSQISGGQGAQAQGRGTAIWTDFSGTAAVNKSFILVGFADGGLWKTADGGAHWQPLTDFEPSLSIGAIDVLPGSDLVNYSDATIYVGTGEGNFSGPDKDGVGVLKSSDGGKSWTIQPLPWRTDAVGFAGAHRIRRLVIDRNVANAQSIWAAADGGVYHTADGGTHWALVTGLPFAGAPEGAPFPGGCWNEYATDFAVDTTDRVAGNSTLFAAFGRPQDSACATTPADARKNNGLYRSVDGGASWQKITLSGANGFAAIPGNLGRVTLLAARSNPKHLYALLQDASSANFGKNLGIYTTADATAGTVQWTAANATTNYTNGQGWYDMTGSVHPTDENRLIVGGLDNYISTDGGTTLTKISGWSAGDNTWAHADHHHAVWVDDSTYFDASDGGFYIGTISGTTATWTPRNGDRLATLQFYGLSQSKTKPYQINAGLQDNGHAFFDGTAWKEAYGGDGGFAATDHDDDSNAYEEYVYAGIRHSSDGGRSFALQSCMQGHGIPPCTGCGVGTICNPDSHTAFIAHFILDAHNQNVMYVGSNYLYRNLNPRAGTPTWTRIASDGVNGDFVKAAASSRAYLSYIHTPLASPADPTTGQSKIIYLGTSTGRIWKSADGGSTWTDLTKAPLPFVDDITGRVLTSIATDPADAGKVLVTYSGFTGSTVPARPGHVFRSLDGGSTWTDISGALPDEPFNTVAINPNPGETGEAYLGSDFGVYLNADIWNGTSWQRINSGLLPHVSVNMLEFTGATSPQRLRAATHGRGVWEMFKTAGSQLALDRTDYACSDTIQITLQTPLPTSAGTQTALVTSASETTPEQVTLVETPAGSGHYVGLVPVSGAPAAPGDGKISVFNADTVHVQVGSLVASAATNCDACGAQPSGAQGANLKITAAPVTVTMTSGDGDVFIDNCETGIITFEVQNDGAVPLTNVRIDSVTPSNPGVRITSLTPVAATLAACAKAPASFSFFASGLVPHETLTFYAIVTANELTQNGVTRTLAASFPESEQDLVARVSKTYSFETSTEGWQVAAGTFTRTNGNGGGATGPNTYYMASSFAQDLACDRVRSPKIKLGPTSTLALFNQYSIEPPSPPVGQTTPQSYDRANVSIYDPAAGTRTVVVPSGGRTYTASGPNGNCVVNSQPGWNAVGAGWQQTTWSAADLQAAAFAGKTVQLEIAYGTDTSVSGTGFWFDEVTLTNFQEQIDDQQSNVCPLPACTLGGGNLCLHTLTPCRILDTRASSDGPLVAGAARTIPIAWQCGVPPSAKAISVNLTITQSTANGSVSLYAADSVPQLGLVNFVAGQTRANNAIASVNPANGTLKAQPAFPGGSGQDSVHIILDVNGYFE
jgi:hypothetical protein